MIWDKERGKIAFRPITRKDARAYRVTFGPKGNYAMFSAKTFMEHIGLDYSETRIVPLTWTDEGMFETEIPIEFLKNQQQQRLIAVEPNRKSGPGKAG
ncbi:MAG: hypothetical protein A3G20_02415 [Acidobacteria bacterium RIFCSPLOWO2_12_FULL_59_11]|nr:MAG: hypothetical protein A3G20_02415 [Acidobacteria bacterium RIFCSPLOWO2_12_FULL_59_11]